MHASDLREVGEENAIRRQAQASGWRPSSSSLRDFHGGNSQSSESLLRASPLLSSPPPCLGRASEESLSCQWKALAASTVEARWTDGADRCGKSEVT